MVRLTEKERKARAKAKKSKSTKLAQLKNIGGIITDMTPSQIKKATGMTPEELRKFQTSGMGKEININNLLKIRGV